MKRLIWIMCFIPVFANANQWQRFYEKDPITDAEMEWAYIENYSSTPANEKVGVTLRVGCASQGAYVSFEFTTKTVEMLYRIDSEEPVQLEKFINFDDFHSSLITGENAIPLIKTMPVTAE